MSMALRVLCLHGGGTHVEIMRLQTAKLRRVLGARAELEFMQGTRVMDAVDPSVRDRFAGPFYGWYDVTHDDVPGRDYTDTLLDNSITFHYPDVDAALARLDRHVASNSYDVLLGFSQGAILITLLTALQLRDGRTPAWRSNALVCPMPVRANRFLHLFPKAAAPLDFPCTVAQGLQDPYYAWCRGVAEQYERPERVDFAGGHRFPHSLADTEALAAAILRACPKSAGSSRVRATPRASSAELTACDTHSVRI